MDISHFPTYIPIPAAAKRYNIPIGEVETAVERGLVRAVAALNGGDTPHILVAEDDVAALVEMRQQPDIPNPANLPHYIPLAQAAKRLGLTPKALTRAIQNGSIKAIATDEGVLVVEMDAERKKRAEEEAARIRAQYRDLEGKPIGIGEAARKYKLVDRTVSNWVKRGYIRLLGKSGQKILIDESDVAYCAEVYKQRGKQGKWLFDKDGLPYIPKNK